MAEQGVLLCDSTSGDQKQPRCAFCDQGCPDSRSVIKGHPGIPGSAWDQNVLAPVAVSSAEVQQKSFKPPVRVSVACIPRDWSRLCPLCAQDGCVVYIYRTFCLYLPYIFSISTVHFAVSGGRDEHGMCGWEMPLRGG